MSPRTLLPSFVTLEQVTAVPVSQSSGGLTMPVSYIEIEGNRMSRTHCSGDVPIFLHSTTLEIKLVISMAPVPTSRINLKVQNPTSKSLLHCSNLMWLSLILT
jgi:hypothetical protein